MFFLSRIAARLEGKQLIGRQVLLFRPCLCHCELIATGLLFCWHSVLICTNSDSFGVLIA